MRNNILKQFEECLFISGTVSIIGAGVSILLKELGYTKISKMIDLGITTGLIITGVYCIDDFLDRVKGAGFLK